MKFLMWILFLVAFSCDDPQGVKQDAGKDAGDDIDVLDIVDVSDITDAVDAEVDALPIDYFEDDFSCDWENSIVKGVPMAYSARYPWIYWIARYQVGSVYYYPFYAHNVETKEIVFIDELLTSPATEPMVHKDSGLYWIGSDIIIDPETQNVSFNSHLYHFSFATNTITELTVDYPLENQTCIEKKGRTSLYDFNEVNGELILRCRHVTPYHYDFYYDFYKMNINTGEQQQFFDGPDLYIFAPRIDFENQNDKYIAMWGMGWTPDGQPDLSPKYLIWDRSNLDLVEYNSWEPGAIGIGGKIGSDGWYYYTVLNDEGTMSITGKNLETGEMMVGPKPEKHVHGPSPTGVNTPQILSIVDGSQDLYDYNGSSGPLFPAYVDSIKLWDQSTGVVKKATVYKREYSAINFMPHEPVNRYLLYRVNWGGGFICIYYRDLYAAGVVDTEGHLIPEK
ncbi:hypothetical protein KKD49_18315 [Myxococcota bacterium]|nr:hypothetical protein [Myxococcota bacterium]